MSAESTPLRSAPSSDTVRIEQMRQLDCDRVLATDDGVAALLEFARKEHSEENMLFYVEAIAWKQSLRDDDAPAVVPAEQAAAIISKYLCEGAELPLTLPEGLRKRFTKRPSSTHSYGAAPTLFDQVLDLTFRQIQTETFRRFKLSEEAGRLAISHPECTMDGQEASTLGELRANALAMQRELRQTLEATCGVVGCERASLWIHSPSIDSRVWSLALTGFELGNSLLGLRLGRGLAGAAAAGSEDLIVNDVLSDSRFNQNVDKASGFVTRSVLCVVLKCPATSADVPDASAPPMATVVVQLVNKTPEGADANAAPDFLASHAEFVRDSMAAQMRAAADRDVLHGLLPRRLAQRVSVEKLDLSSTSADDMAW